MGKKLFTILVWVTAVSFAAVTQAPMMTGSQHSLFEQIKDENLIATGLSPYVPPRIVDGVPLVHAFIGIEDDEVIEELTSMGVSVEAVFDGFVTAQIPVDLLDSVSRLPKVTDVEPSRKVQLCTDTTLSVTHAGQVINGQSNGLPYSYDGSGVIVGIIDNGFDLQHRAFRRADDTRVTRIKRLYNTQITSGHPARTNQWGLLPGSVFMDDEIYGLKYDVTGTHGTHTAGIAAGTNVNGYGGMAPGADIVLCAVSVLDGGLSTVEIVNCVRYICAYADSVGKPCVMSLSVSTPNGQHDGQDYLSKAVAQCVGKGRIFVISSGNNGDCPMYAHKRVTMTDPINLLFKSKIINNVDSSYFYNGVLAEVWMRGSRTRPDYKCHVLDLTTGRIVWESEVLSANRTITASELSNYYTFSSNIDTTGYFKVFVKTSSDGKKYDLDVSIHNLVCKKYTTINGVRTSRYAIGMSVYPRNSTQSDVDVWLNNSSSRFGSFKLPVITLEGDTIMGFYTPSNSDCTIGTYAVNDSVISAGAFVARNSYYSLTQDKIITDNSVVVGDIAGFSSYQAEGAGPTGQALPTICAPGFAVVAAASRYSYLANNTNTVMRTEDGSYWGVMSGTSMAAPTVAGIIALWLQANPSLSVSQIKNIIANTSIRDRYTQGEHHAQFGPNGKIDAMAGMKMVLSGLDYKTGDVNCDGYINIADVTSLIALLIGKPKSFFMKENADMNEDGFVSIDDLTLLIRFLLKGSIQ